MTPLPAHHVAEKMIQAVLRGAPRLVLPRTATMLLLGEAMSPHIGDYIASALASGWLARILRFDRGRTYHEERITRWSPNVSRYGYFKILASCWAMALLSLKSGFTK